MYYDKEFYFYINIIFVVFGSSWKWFLFEVVYKIYNYVVIDIKW